jgi:zinc protease
MKRLFRERSITHLLVLFVALCAAGCGKKGNVVSTRLDSGVTVVFKTMPGSDVATVLLLAAAGSAYETESNRGISRLLERCLFRATEGQPDVRKTIDAYGGVFNSNVNQDFISFAVTVEKANLLKMIRVAASVVDSSRIDEALVRSVKSGLLKAMEGEEENPRVAALNLFLRNAFPEGPYRFFPLGKTKTVETLNADDVVRYYQSRFVPESVVFVVTGDFDRKAVLKTLQGCFQSFRLRPKAKPALQEQPEPAEPKRIRSTFNFPPNIAMVTVGWKAPSIRNPDTYDVDVLVSCLGTGQASRLNTQIRVGMDSVYSIWAEYLTPRQPGYLLIACICHPQVAERVRERILREVDILKKDLITPAELVRAKAALKSIKAYSDQSTNGTASYLGYGTILGSPDFTVHYDRNIDAVTAGDVRLAAVRYLKSDHYTSVILFPKNRPGASIERRLIP